MRQSRFLDYRRRPWTDSLNVIRRLLSDGDIHPVSERHGPVAITHMGESWAIHREPPDDACQRIVTDLFTLESMDIGAWRSEFVYHHLGAFNV